MDKDVHEGEGCTGALLHRPRSISHQAAEGATFDVTPEIRDTR